MDRKTWIAVGLSLIGLLAWQWWYSKTYEPYFKEQQALAAQGHAESPTPSPTPAPTPTPAAKPRELVAAKTQVLRSEGKGDLKADFVFVSGAGGIQNALLLSHFGESQRPVALGADRDMPIGAIGEVPGEVLGGFQMAAGTSNDAIIFSRQFPDGLAIDKKFSLPPRDNRDTPYVVYLDITFRNTGPQEISKPGYFVSTGAAAPIHPADMSLYTRFDWYRRGKMTSIDVNWFDPGSIPLIGIEYRQAQPVYFQTAEEIAWAAVSSQYFCTIVTALETQGNSVWAKRFGLANSEGKEVHGIQGGLGLPPFKLAAAETRTHRFLIYAGPKELARLDRLGHGTEAAMNFGMFGFVSKFLLWAMNGLHGILHNYAAAIIVLTIFIKLALWPLQNQATNSMKKMAALSPKMTELREKYKDDPQKMNEELMKLYREYGVNPFGGCLPLLIQIPIFFGFYSMLGVAIELRNSSFLWVRDLSQPDTIFHVLGFPINILPLVMAGTMVWQMAITPKTGDATQQRIMLFMPVIFIVFAYNYASALSLYWTTQNLFSIVQLYLTRNKPAPVPEKVSVAAKRGAQEPKRKRKKRALP